MQQLGQKKGEPVQLSLPASPPRLTATGKGSDARNSTSTIKLLQQTAPLQPVEIPRVDKLFRLGILRGGYGLGQVVQRVFHPSHIDIRGLLQDLANVKIVGFLKNEGIRKLGLISDGPKGQLSIGAGALDGARIGAHEAIHQFGLSLHDVALHDQGRIRKGDIHIGDIDEFLKPEPFHREEGRRRNQSGINESGTKIQRIVGKGQ